MKIGLIILAAVLFLLLMPIAALIRYNGDFSIRVGLFCPFWKIYPVGRKKKKNKSDAKKKNQKETPAEKVKLKLDRDVIFGLLKKFPGYFKRLLVIREIFLDAELGNEDPADLALTYGAVQAGLSTASSVLDSLYPVEKWKIRVEADFEKHESKIQGRISMHTNLLRILLVLISFGIYVIINSNDEKER